MTNVVSIRKRTTKVCQRCRERKPVDQFERLPVRKRTAVSYSRCFPCREIIATRPPHAVTQNSWIPEDGIVDDLAVHIAAHGTRRVALTLREARQAATIMRAWGLTGEVIGERVGATPGCVRAWEWEGKTGYEAEQATEAA